MSKQKWENIIIHCSDSSWGSEKEIRHWHVDKNGWSDTGYHFIILNGRIRPNFYLEGMQGSIEVGRMLDGDSIVDSEEIGAHALGYNNKSIGICLIGAGVFSYPQINSLTGLVRELQLRFNIPIHKVLGHYEVDTKGKTCPNIKMDVFRRSLDPGGLFPEIPEKA